MAGAPGWTALAAGLAVVGLLPQTAAPTLRLTATVPLPGVQGRIDHLTADVAGRRLFVAALGNDTVEVLDLGASRVTRSIHGLDEPQGLTYLAGANQLVVANGGNGATQFFETSHYTMQAAARLSGDADNVRYDAGAKRVYVGYGNGALAVLGIDG